MSGHKIECESAAYACAEGELYPISDPARAEQRAAELFSTGEVSCICSELPS